MDKSCCPKNWKEFKASLEPEISRLKKKAWVHREKEDAAGAGLLFGSAAGAIAGGLLVGLPIAAVGAIIGGGLGGGIGGEMVTTKSWSNNYAKRVARINRCLDNPKFQKRFKRWRLQYQNATKKERSTPTIMFGLEQLKSEILLNEAYYTECPLCETEQTPELAGKIKCKNSRCGRVFEFEGYV